MNKRQMDNPLNPPLVAKLLLSNAFPSLELGNEYGGFCCIGTVFVSVLFSGSNGAGA